MIVKEVELQFIGGIDIDEARRQAAIYALTEKVPVKFDFNGRLFRVNPEGLLHAFYVEKDNT